jgi:Mg2+ and Co2+ transporter CorA
MTANNTQQDSADPIVRLLELEIQELEQNKLRLNAELGRMSRIIAESDRDHSETLRQLENYEKLLDALLQMFDAWWHYPEYVQHLCKIAANMIQRMKNVNAIPF